MSTDLKFSFGSCLRMGNSAGLKVSMSSDIRKVKPCQRQFRKRDGASLTCNKKYHSPDDSHPHLLDLIVFQALHTFHANSGHKDGY